MQNPDLVEDYLRRSKARLKAIQVLMDEKSWADVVRESQEVIELCLKALIRHVGIESPRVHDVSPILNRERSRFSEPALSATDRMIEISKESRRDRELSFYGSEDLTPSAFYTEKDAKKAFDSAHEILEIVERTIFKAP